MNLFDHAAQVERDAALKRVSDNAEPWSEQALKAIPRLHFPETFTGEDLRRIVTDEIGSPHHHNAWGALIMAALKRGLIVKTGEWRSMTGEKSHARMTPVYRKGRG